jgi:putative oxidoreductase
MMMKKTYTDSLLLRLAVAIVFLTHSLHGIFTNNDVNDFGRLFLDQKGFAPFGVGLAWSIVIVQIASSILLLVNLYVKTAAAVNIAILVMGIALVHFKEGWFVVGAGRNGMEFSVLLIFVLLAIVLQKRL